MSSGTRLRTLETTEYAIILAGNGAPAAFAGEGTLYWDYTNDDLYVNEDGLNGWQLIGGGGGPGFPHAILSATHTDANPQAVTRGSLIYGTAVPQWDELNHPGAANRVLQSSAADVQWSTWALAGTAGQTYTFPVVTGGVALGAGTLTVATGNDATIANHTHAITSSSNPGAAASILASAPATGYLQLTGLGVGAAASAANAVTLPDAGWIGNSAATARLHFDSSGATDYAYFSGCNVGIGTSSPGTRMEIIAFGAVPFGWGDASRYGELTYDANNPIMRALTARGLLFQTNGNNTRMTIAVAGNVGVGTASPDRLFHAEVADAATNSVTTLNRWTHVTSNTAVTGFGVGYCETELEENDGTARIASLFETIWADAGEVVSADADLIIKLMENDAAVAERARLTSGGDWKITNDYYSGGSQGLSGTLTLDDGANWRITLTFTGGILTGQTTGASVAATATWV